MRGSWFEELFGVEEPIGRPKEIQRLFTLQKKVNSQGRLEELYLKSETNGKLFPVGTFSTPTIQELRQRLITLLNRIAAFELIEPVTDISFVPFLEIDHIPIPGALQIHSQYPLATFQAASQFNCLEFPTPRTTPEQGITFYWTDRTQGPACAIACAAGTLYRNYFVPITIPASQIFELPLSLQQSITVEGQQIGQSKLFQLNTLERFDQFLDNSSIHQYWYQENGYTFSRDITSLQQFQKRLETDFATPERYDLLVSQIQLGLQERVGVTFDDQERVPVQAEETPRVTQVYCSAISCAYSGIETAAWAPLARIVLEGMYEGTVLVGVVQWLDYLLTLLEEEHQPEDKTGRVYPNEIFLTLVGGGVFGNELSWISAAMVRGVEKVEKLLQSYRSPLRRFLSHLAKACDRDQKEEMSDLLFSKGKVHICHYRQLNPSFVAQVEALTAYSSSSM